MPDLDFDFNDVPDTPQPLPEGQYSVEITEATVEPTRKGDSMKLSLRMSVLDGPEKGRVQFDAISLKMKPRIKQVFIACGLGEWDAEAQQYQVESTATEDLLGAQLEIKTRRDSWVKDGEPQVSSKVLAYVFDANPS